MSSGTANPAGNVLQQYLSALSKAPSRAPPIQMLNFHPCYTQWLANGSKAHTAGNFSSFCATAHAHKVSGLKFSGTPCSCSVKDATFDSAIDPHICFANVAKVPNCGYETQVKPDGSNVDADGKTLRRYAFPLDRNISLATGFTAIDMQENAASSAPALYSFMSSEVLVLTAAWQTNTVSDASFANRTKQKGYSMPFNDAKAITYILGGLLPNLASTPEIQALAKSDKWLQYRIQAVSTNQLIIRMRQFYGTVFENLIGEEQMNYANMHVGDSHLMESADGITMGTKVITMAALEAAGDKLDSWYQGKKAMNDVHGKEYAQYVSMFTKILESESITSLFTELDIGNADIATQVAQYLAPSARSGDHHKFLYDALRDAKQALLGKDKKSKLSNQEFLEKAISDNLANLAGMTISERRATSRVAYLTGQSEAVRDAYKEAGCFSDFAQAPEAHDDSGEE